MSQTNADSLVRVQAQLEKAVLEVELEQQHLARAIAKAQRLRARKTSQLHVNEQRLQVRNLARKAAILTPSSCRCASFEFLALRVLCFCNLGCLLNACKIVHEATAPDPVVLCPGNASASACATWRDATGRVAGAEHKACARAH